MKSLQLSALVCTLCGIKGENLKQVPNVGFAREFYDCIQRHIGSDLGNRKQFEEAKNSCTAECFETLLAVKEALCLISGQEFHLAKKSRELLKTIDASDKWRVQKENQEKTRPPASASKEVPEEQPEESAPEMMEFGGEAEEQYVEEEPKQEDDTASNLPLRDPSKNFYIHRK